MSPARADAEGADWRESRNEWCCILIRNMNLIAPVGVREPFNARKWMTEAPVAGPVVVAHPLKR